MSEPAPTGAGRVAVSCPGCDEKYIVEVSRIPPQGGKLTCRICGGRVSLPRLDAASSLLAQPQVPAETLDVAIYGVTSGEIADPTAPASPHLGSDGSGARTAHEIRCPHCSRWFASDAAEERGAPPSTLGPDPRRTVLVVEDTEYFLQLAQDALGGRYRTVGARDPGAALQALREGHVDLLVLDLTLEKEEDGLLVLAEASMRHIPCLIFTAKGEAEMWGEAWDRLRGLGATDLLLKGMNFEEQLISKVDAMFATNVA